MPSIEERIDDICRKLWDCAMYPWCILRRRCSIHHGYMTVAKKSEKDNHTVPFQDSFKMSTFPTLSSSTPMSDWFSSVTLLFNTVQQQAATIRTLQDRIVVLETRMNIPATVPEVENPHAKEPKSTKTKDAKTEKKRGRKVEVHLAEFLHEVRLLPRCWRILANAVRIAQSP